jgi:uncharacterized membrane protein
MSTAGRGVGLILACGVLLIGCSSSTTSSSTTSATASPTAAASRSADAIDEWCNSYAGLSKVLSDAGTKPESTTKALQALDRYAKLWKLAGEGGLLSPEETNANLRAVIVYRQVIQAIAGGMTEDSAEVTALKDTVRTQTENDHGLLQSSAGKVVALCGQASPRATPSAS